MAKRFTDTAKWDKSWYRKLGAEGRDIWNYFLENCDSAGIWEIDLERAEFDLGYPITLDRVCKVFGDRVTDLGDKLFFHAFIGFQYGELSSSCRGHTGTIRRLRSLGLEDFVKGYGNPLVTLQDQDKDQDQDQEEESEEIYSDALTPRQLLELWNQNRGDLPEARTLTEKRRASCRAQIKINPDVAHWLSVIQRWQRSHFCTTEWRPGFDDLLSENKRVSTLEGKYDNRPSKNATAQTLGGICAV